MLLLGQAVLNFPELSPQVQSLLKRPLGLLIRLPVSRLGQELTVSRLGQELNFLLEFLSLFSKVLKGLFGLVTVLLQDPSHDLLESETAGPQHQEVF